MMKRFLVLSAVLVATSGCVPAAIGGVAVIGADTIAEDRNGGDGLF